MTIEHKDTLRAYLTELIMFTCTTNQPLTPNDKMCLQGEIEMVKEYLSIVNL